MSSQSGCNLRNYYEKSGCSSYTCEHRATLSLSVGSFPENLRLRKPATMFPLPHPAPFSSLIAFPHPLSWRCLALSHNVLSLSLSQNIIPPSVTTCSLYLCCDSFHTCTHGLAQMPLIIITKRMRAAATHARHGILRFSGQPGQHVTDLSRLSVGAGLATDHGSYLTTSQKNELLPLAPQW